MNGFGEHSDESQATQLLENVLRRDIEATNQCRGDSEAPRCIEDQSMMHDSTSSNSTTHTHLPQYHFHGLAETQTDSQWEVQSDCEDSQKENTPASWDTPPIAQTSSVPPSPRMPAPMSDKPAQLPSAVGQGLSPSRPTFSTTGNTNHSLPILQPAALRGPFKKPNSLSMNASKAVSFRSPDAAPRCALHPGVARSSNTSHAQQRSPSPPSEDSLAGCHPFQKPEQSFGQNAEQADSPLSPEEDPSAGIETSRLASMCRTASVYAIPAQNRRVAPPTPTRPVSSDGILVAATPSNSSQSDSQGPTQLISNAAESQYGGTQVSDMFPQRQAQSMDIDMDELVGGQKNPRAETQHLSPRDASTEPSSSYERLMQNVFEYNADSAAATKATTQPASQPATQLATQPATQVATQLATPPTDGDVPPSVQSANSAEAVPQKVRGLVGNKFWRYKALFPDEVIPGGTMDTPPPSSVMQRQPGQDLLPSNVSAVHGSVATNVSAPPAPVPPSQYVGASGSQDDDDLDVVPDSESADAELVYPNTSPSAPPRPSAPPPPPLAPPPAPVAKLAPAGRVAQSRKRENDENSDEEIVPDSAAHDEDMSPTDIDDEEDVPLAATVLVTHQQKGKGKAPAGPVRRIAALPSPSKRLSNKKSAEPFETATGTRGITSRRKALGSRETKVIPSSDPAQDYGTPADHADAGSSKGGLVVQPCARATKTHRNSSIPRNVCRVAAARGTVETITEVNDMDMEIPDCGNEVATEPADDGDNYRDIDVESAVSETFGRARKRRRVVSSKKKPSRKINPVARVGKAPSSVAGGGRQAKKLKAASTDMTEDFTSATRVFALWKQNGHYYAGTVHSQDTASPQRYVVNFDDGTSGKVDISKMRLCMLKYGDNVILGDNQGGRVTNDGPVFNADDMVTVAMNDGDDVVTITVELQEVRIASLTLRNEWDDRKLVLDKVVPVLRRRLTITPSPSKMTVLSSGSSRGTRNPLAKTGFVVTLAAGNDHWQEEKERVITSIKNLGGTVIDNWTDIFTMDGVHYQKQKRWILRREDLKRIKCDGVERVFLLSDDANQKPKFLMALALGIPCLSVKWIEHLARVTDYDWQPFLLPAGYSDILDARITQMVTLEWGNSIHHLEGIMHNSVAMKPFTDLSILCVSPEWVPLYRNSTRSVVDATKATHMVPRILLCMGASCVEAVSDVTHASCQDLKKYDYVVVQEQRDATRILATNHGVKCVHFPWVKDCLIAGRLFEVPQN